MTGAHSVWPYPSALTAVPNRSSNSSCFASGSGIQLQRRTEWARSDSAGGVARMARAMAPTPITTLAPTSPARAMNVDAEKAGSRTRVAPRWSVAMRASAWPLRWKSGKAVKYTSSGRSSSAACHTAPMWT